MTKMYRVHWKIEAIRATGNGHAMFTHEDAKDVALVMNTQSDGSVVYWVEPVEEESDE